MQCECAFQKDLVNPLLNVSTAAAAVHGAESSVSPVLLGDSTVNTFSSSV